MSGREVRERIALALVAAWRQRVAYLEGHAIEEHDGIVVAWSNQRDPSLSVALVERRPRDPVAAIRVAERAFDERGGTFGIDLERRRHPDVDDAVRAIGLSVVESRPAMHVDVASVLEPPWPDGFEVHRVVDDADLEPMVAIEIDAFGTAPDVAERIIAPPILERARAWLGTHRGEPVATAYVYEHEGALGLFGVAVSSHVRRRGFGAAITARAIRDAAEDTDADMAWLQSSPDGGPVYARLGFETVSTWDVWVRSA